MNPPPMAESLETSVIRGDTIEIPLRASGRTPGQIRFIVRGNPRHGTLGEIKSTSGKTAVVSYHQNKAGGARADSFRYAVQAVDSPVSAPAEVQIAIQEPPPKLSVPGLVEFGETGLGSPSVQVVEIKNTGGQTATINPRTEPPWRVTPEGEAAIPPGGTCQWVVEFAPSSAGPKEGRLVFPEFPSSSIRLTGLGIELFEVRPGGALVARGANREFPEFSVHNLTADDHRVEFLVPEGISEIQATQLVGRQSITLRPKIIGEWLGPIGGHLVVRMGDTTIEIPLSAEGAPPKLVFHEASRIDFGKVLSGTRIEQRIALANVGGSVARLDAVVPEGLLVLPPPSTIVLPPGAEKIFSVVLETSVDGFFSEEILFSAGEDNILPLVVQALVETPPLPSISNGPIQTKSLLPPEAVDLSEQELREEEPGVPWEPPGGFRLVSQKPGTVEIGWTEEDPATARYLVEYRSLKFQGEDLPPEILWEAFREVRFQRNEGEILAGINRLPENSSWVIRVVPVETGGVRGSPSAPMRIASPPRPRPPGFLWLLPVAALVAAGYFAYRKIRFLREKAADAERGRITRLERGG